MVLYFAMQPMQEAMIQHLAEGAGDIETGLQQAQKEAGQDGAGQDGRILYSLPCP